MTIEKALQTFKLWEDICNKYMHCSCEECEKECFYPIVINALEKQIPKKANLIRNEQVVYWNIAICECPVCGEEIRFVDHNEIKYCSHCGQALKCEGEEDDKN